MTRRPLRLAAATAGAALLVAACGSSSSSSSSTTAAGATTATTAAAGGGVDSAAAALVPAKLKTAGVVQVATDATYAPNEFQAANGSIEGMDVDLGTAIGKVLGVPFKFSNQSFDSIIGTLGTRYDLGISSFTDTKAREKQVTMVDYFSAGESFMVNKGQHTNLTSLASLCNLNVGVEKGTTELDDATTQSKSCKVNVQAFDTETEVNQALSAGRVDVAFADSPVNAYYAKQSNGTFQIVGPILSTAPYGMAVPLGADYQGFDKAIAAALTDLQKSGTYQQILSKWGVQAGAISSFTINGATS
ncbi:ABC transporter substrate-binding protein [Acidiferrimicrobium sp. IK]|uniref:ABC transporter substrate-binding protein n=1 Tax=Acidiferrimicrobium sp. IK TaxID=2871700 RepID=UPI0021CAF511|nr:ABC transporter substrate-binding protein [Acidiferrimicrobium sp. IK]MCU4186081.1 ABC transporter substrate-binding protein [Acidiferrimicrobium sp. IK]